MTPEQRTEWVFKRAKHNPNVYVSNFLVASYLYYICDISLMTDLGFDKMCHEMVKQWDRIDHPHKDLISVDDLEAGTGFTLKEKDYPGIVVGSATQLAIMDKLVKLDKRNKMWVKKDT